MIAAAFVLFGVSLVSMMQLTGPSESLGFEEVSDEVLFKIRRDESMAFINSLGVKQSEYRTPWQIMQYFWDNFVTSDNDISSDIINSVKEFLPNDVDDKELLCNIAVEVALGYDRMLHAINLNRTKLRT